MYKHRYNMAINCGGEAQCLVTSRCIEAAHVLTFLVYGVKATATITSTTGLTTPEPNTLTPDQLTAVYVAGVCGEVLYGDHKVSPHIGAYGDSLNICRVLNIDERQNAHGIATCIALLAEGKTAKFLPPPEVVEKLKKAIAEAKQTLARHQRVLKQITTTLTEHGRC